MNLQVAPRSGLAPLDSLGDAVARLSRASRLRYENPFLVDWPDLVDPDDAWFSTPELTSLYGTDLWDALDTAQQRRFAFFEACNFFSLNIHGERSLMEGLAARLYRPGFLAVSEYLHHFLDEENKHSIHFGRFCGRYGKIYPAAQVAFERETASGEADLLFFAKVLIFEELVDRYNVIQSRDERLHSISRFINHNHHVEETRHLAFGRRVVDALWNAYSADWEAERVALIRRYLSQFFVTCWRQYYNPAVYGDCGLSAPWDTAELAWSAASQREHRRLGSARVVAFLLDTGVLDKEPTDAY